VAGGFSGLGNGEHADEVAQYSLIFDYLRASAMADEKSAEFIRRILND
jgi:hypothetical protein